jgi:colicin import membrane protein
MDRALASDDLRPQRPGGLGRGALLAIAAHVGLIIALAIGVNWRASEPAGVSAELWAQVPQAAAPKLEAPVAEPKPEPPPPPKPAVAEPPPPAPARDAEIALEEQKKKQAAERRARELEEKRKADAERREKERELAEAKKKAEADERERIAEARRQKAEEEAQAKRAEELRKANLDRMMAQAGGTGGPTATGQAARDAGPSASYAGRIIARIRPNIVLMDTVARRHHHRPPPAQGQRQRRLGPGRAACDRPHRGAAARRRRPCAGADDDRVPAAGLIARLLAAGATAPSCRTPRRRG